MKGLSLGVLFTNMVQRAAKQDNKFLISLFLQYSHLEVRCDCHCAHMTLCTLLTNNALSIFSFVTFYVITFCEILLDISASMLQNFYVYKYIFITLLCS